MRAHTQHSRAFESADKRSTRELTKKACILNPRAEEYAKFRTLILSGNGDELPPCPMCPPRVLFRLNPVVLIAKLPSCSCAQSTDKVSWCNLCTNTGGSQELKSSHKSCHNLWIVTALFIFEFPMMRLWRAFNVRIPTHPVPPSPWHPCHPNPLGLGPR